MSVKAINAAMACEADLSSGQRLVLFALAHHANAAWRSWPSVERLAEETHLSERSVWRALRRLRGNGDSEPGLIRCVKEGGGAGQTAVYDLTPLRVEAGKNPDAGVRETNRENPDARDRVIKKNPDADVRVAKGKTLTHVSQNPDVCVSKTLTPVSPKRKYERTSNVSTPPPHARADEQEPEAPETAVPAIPEEVVVFLQQEVTEKRQNIFKRQLEKAVREHDPEPVRRALKELDRSLTDGQRPEDPDKLPGYFRPILDRHVEDWKQEKREEEIQEKREAARENQRQEAEDTDPEHVNSVMDNIRNRLEGTPAGEDLNEEQRREQLQQQADTLEAESNAG